MSRVKELAAELKPFTLTEPLGAFVAKRFVPVLVAFFVLSVWMVGQKEVLGLRWGQAVFVVKNGLWITVALASFVAFYDSSFPQRSRRLPGRVAMGALGLLLALEFHQLNYAQLPAELHTEMDFFRGGCGVIISAMSMGYWWMLKNWARRGAPRSPEITGLWASIAASSAGCVLMQAVCWQEGTLHILLWHFLPMTLACYAGPVLAKKWLRW
jgi:hypothetical protein